MSWGLNPDSTAPFARVGRLSSSTSRFLIAIVALKTKKTL